MRLLSPVLMISTFLGVSSSYADSLAPFELSPIIVTATWIPTPVEKVSQSATVLTSEEIQKKGWRTLPEALRAVPGLIVIQAGGMGAPTSLFMRGTEARHTKILLDGMDIGDPSTPNGALDLGSLSLYGIDRIEIVRGPQSGLYGSDAIGGVVNLLTKKGEGPPQFSLDLEAGSSKTFAQSLAVMGSWRSLDYHFGVEHRVLGDQNVTPFDLWPAGIPYLSDRAEQTSVFSKMSFSLTPHLRLGTLVRYGALGLDFVSTPGAAKAQSITHTWLSRTTAEWSFRNTEHTFGIGYLTYDREYRYPGTIYPYEGHRLTEDWRTKIAVTPSQTVILGALHQSDGVNALAGKTLETTAGFVELHSQLGTSFQNTMNARIDHTPQWGAHGTYRLSPQYSFSETGTVLKGSFGTGFKAPSLSQLYQDYPPFFFSNPHLRPETSLGYELGVEQDVFGGKGRFGVTYFHNRLSNMIAPDASYTTYENIGRATTYGIETFAHVHLSEAVSLRAHYTWTKARDEQNGLPLKRRPEHKASVTVEYDPTDHLSLSAGMVYTGRWWDVPRSFGAARLAPGYIVCDLSASYALSSQTKMYAKIENLFNQHYENPIGFEGKGLSVLVGVSFQGG